MAAHCPVDHGFSYDPFVNPQRDDPHPVWETARETAPVAYSQVLGAWVVTRYDLVRTVLADPKTFLNSGSTSPVKPVPAEVAAILQRGLPSGELRSTVSLDGDEHQRIRKFLISVLTPRRFGDLEGTCRDIANALIDSFIGDGQVDFVERFAYRLPLAVIAELMVIAPDDFERLHAWSSSRMALSWGDMPLDEHIAAAESVLEFQNYLMKIVESRRTAPGKDVVSELIELQLDERPLTDSEIVGIMMGFVAAGHETTMNFLSLTILHCLERPGMWDALRDDPSRITPMVEESLRFDSPAQAIWRTVGEETELGGVELPARSRLLLVLGSANRDSEAYVEPEQLLLTRQRQSPHVAFGRGIHACVGAGLARLEGRIALEELTRRFPELRVADGFRATFTPNAVQRFLETLPLEWPVQRADH